MCPEFNLVQDGCAGSLEAVVTATMSILGTLCTPKIVEENRFSCQKDNVRKPSSKRGSTGILTGVLPMEVISLAQM